MLSIKRVCVILKIALWCIALCYFYTKICRGKFWYARVIPSMWKCYKVQSFGRYLLSFLLSTWHSIYHHTKYMEGAVARYSLMCFLSLNFCYTQVSFNRHILLKVTDAIISSSLYMDKYAIWGHRKCVQDDCLLCPITEDKPQVLRALYELGMVVILFILSRIGTGSQESKHFSKWAMCAPPPSQKVLSYQPG